MDTYKVSNFVIPDISRICIPESEGVIAPPAVAQIFFKSTADAKRFQQWMRADYLYMKCSAVKSDDKALQFRILGGQNILTTLRAIFGWEKVDRSLIH